MFYLNISGVSLQPLVVTREFMGNILESVLLATIPQRSLTENKKELPQGTSPYHAEDNRFNKA